MSPLHEQQLAALDLVMAGHNVLILGTAGTGKSFLVREIVKQSQEKGIHVALTCTTGIACAVYSNLSKTLRAQTIHQWSGIDDGRFAPSEIKNVLKNNVEHSKTVETIKRTDLLIIDECSMISKKMFNSLAEVCSIKNENMNFGGIQLVLVGDFHQLPPVPNLLCNDDGDFCFNSKIFDSVITHRVTMTSVMRQTEDILIKAVQEVSLGKLSDETKVFIETLKRPLPDGEANIKLFSTNDRVDDFNRDRILDFPGPLYEFVASDSGDKKYLSHILAPHILWLKKGAPVILLRNLSDKLFNGLRGEVYDIVDGGAIIEFPSVGLKIPVQKMKFSVFSCRQNKDIAFREQLPLKLAFALTIHKSQGMTLERVEIDCNGVFKPGQLGVAIGRARTIKGLRVLNFNCKACIPHPESLEYFLNIPGQQPLSDMSCCQTAIRHEPNPFLVHPNETVPCVVDNNIDLNFDSDFDEEFDEVIRKINTEESDTDLPQELNLDLILENLKTKDAVTPFQNQTNIILNEIDRSKFKTFCQREYRQITSLVEKMNFQGPVKCKDLGDFYTCMHAYHTGCEFLLSCMMLFDNQSFTAEKKHICYNASIEIRKYILGKRAELYPSTTLKLTARSVTSASKARIRYIGGYCIAKVRAKYLNKKETLRYSKSAEQQNEYQDSVYATHLLNNMREDEQFLLSNSAEPDSLLDVNRKQYINRGLTNISDELFLFFTKLAEQCLSLLSDKYYHQYGSQMFQCCREKIEENNELYKSFTSIVDNLKVQKESEDAKSHEERVMKLIYQKIVKMFLLVLFGQFRKDLLDAFQVTKKMAHRKQIQVSTGAKPENQNRTAKREAKGIQKRTSKQKKLAPSATLQSKDESSHQETPYHDLNVLPEQESTRIVSENPNLSTSQEILAQHSPEPSTSQVPDDTDDTLCKSCWTEDRDVEWIQCDSCSGWYHRSCAGLKNHMKWKKFQKLGAKYYCNNCQ